MLASMLFALVFGGGYGGGYLLLYPSWMVYFEDCCMLVGCSGFPMCCAGGTFHMYYRLGR